MLRLQALQLFNWGFAPFQVPLPIGDITLLRGRNGSGKTTYLNALTLLMGARQLPKRQPFDKFVYPEERWAFIRAIADNSPEANGRRPFGEVISTLEEQVTLACVLERKNSWRRTYYIVPGDYIPTPDKPPDKEFCFTQTQYRELLSKVGVQDALLNLVELGLYGMREIARVPRHRFDFFLKLVGNAEIQQRYQDARQEWWKQREQTMRFESNLKQDQAQLSEMAEAIKVLREKRKLEQQAAQAKLLVPHAKRREFRLKFTESEAKASQAQKQVSELSRQIASLQQQQKQLKAEYTAFQARYQSWKQERDQTEKEAKEAYSTFRSTQTIYDQQKTYVATLQALPNTPLVEAERAYQEAQNAVNAASFDVQQLEEEDHSLKEERRGLRNNQISLPHYVERFIRALDKERIPYLLVADVVEITDSTWQQAVEGALGGERFTIIVEHEKARIRAKELGQQQKYRYYVSPSNYKLPKKLHRDSLWHVVEVSNPAAQGWVADSLAKLLRVPDVRSGHQMGKQGIRTITEQAYLQGRRGGHSVWTRDLVCGRAAIKIRLEEVESSLRDLAPKWSEAKQKKDLAQKRRQDADKLVRQVEGRAKLPDALAELARLKEDVATQQAESERLENNYRALKGREESWNEERADFATRRESLAGEQRGYQADLQDYSKQLNQAQTESNRFQRRILQLEAELPELTHETVQAFAKEQLTAEAYQERVRQAKDKISQLQVIEKWHDIDERLYERQRANVSHLRQEVASMWQREGEYHELFEAALQDFRTHIDELFNKGMARSFRHFCKVIGALGDVVVRGQDDRWEMDVKIGFHGKERQRWEVAPLSQGQEVMTGLLLVLAALQAVGATPILLLDELMSTLDEVNAPLVLQQLRLTGAQCFVATPHVRPQADVIPDVIWELRQRRQTEDYAPPIAVLVRRSEE